MRMLRAIVTRTLDLAIPALYEEPQALPMFDEKRFTRCYYQRKKKEIYRR